MMWNRFEQLVKGLLWGLLIILMMQTCVSCGTTTRYGESMAISDVSKASVEAERDSINCTLLAETIRQLTIDNTTSQQTERITYSQPDTQGNQYITSVERTQTLSELTAEEHNSSTLLVEYKRMQSRIDSLQERVRNLEQEKKETKKTSGGMFSWTGKEVAAILALVLLIIIAWIIIKVRGFV